MPVDEKKYAAELTEDQIRTLAGLADAEGEALESGDYPEQNADSIGFHYHLAGVLLATLGGNSNAPG